MNLIENVLKEIGNCKIIVYGADMTGLSFALQMKMRGRNIAYFIDGSRKKQGKTILNLEIKNPIELLYENNKEIKIVICAMGAREPIIQNLTNMGIPKENIVSSYSKRDASDHADALLGISRGSKTIIKMDKCEKKNNKKLLILGGSTSDPSFDGIHSWSWYLQNMFDRNGDGISIYNSAVVGYSTSQELLGLLRDGIKIHPDIVVSYSGFNDLAPALDLLDGKRYSLVSRNLYDWHEQLASFYRKQKGDFPPIYYGEKIEDYFENFIFNIRCINSICNEFGAKYFAIFQPVIKNQMIAEKDKSDFNNLMNEEIMISPMRSYELFHKKIREAVVCYKYLHDFSDIFQKETHCFIDSCHTNEKGNKILALNIYRLLKDGNDNVI